MAMKSNQSQEDRKQDDDDDLSSFAIEIPPPKLLEMGRASASTVPFADDSSHDSEEIAVVHRGDAKEMFKETHAHALKRELTAANFVKVVGSSALLVFCCVLLFAALFSEQTRATGEYDLNPVAAFLTLLLVLSWLAVIEGGLNCTVALQAVDGNRFKDTHPITYRSTTIASGDNLERYIVGRQYMDLSMVFLISFLCTTSSGVSVLGLPPVVMNIFLVSGWAMTNITIVFGQLMLQINAAECMIDYMNNYVVLFSTYMALFVEMTGVCHSAYLIQIVAAKLSGKKIHRHNERTLLQKVFFWLRVTLSVGLLVFSLSATLAAIFQYSTKMFEGVPSWLSVVLLVALIILVGMLDALQIAICAVAHIDADTLEHHPTAKSNSDYITQGKRLPSFLLGRQIGQTVVQFLLARITTMDVDIGNEPNIFGVSDTLQKLFNSGFLGAIIATVLASLSWRVLASNFPIFFLDRAISRPLLELCLLAERTGVIHVSWPLSRLHRKLAGLSPDETYLSSNTAAKQVNGDLESDLQTDENITDHCEYTR